jgi:hypothetical protein
MDIPQTPVEAEGSFYLSVPIDQHSTTPPPKKKSRDRDSQSPKRRFV